MRTLITARRTLVICAAVFAMAVLGAAPATASREGGLTGGCDPYVDGTLIPVPCSAASANSGSGGNGGPGGATVHNSCAATVLGMAQALSLGLSWPPPAGHSWALLLCLAGVLGAGPQAILVNSASGIPAVTPQQLMVRAFGELRVPQLKPYTAPPRGHDGLVGLPEWFWIAAGSWRARTVKVTAGPVWAAVTATPVDLMFRPGPGLSSVRCSGPGIAYNPLEPSTAQRTACSYTYVRSSTGQPGNAYPASLTVAWQITWTGSGGSGGVLDANLPVSVTFNIPVAQGEALVTSP